LVHLGDSSWLSRAHVATPRALPWPDQCVEQGTVVGTVTRGLDDHVLVDAQELAEAKS